MIGFPHSSLCTTVWWLATLGNSGPSAVVEHRYSHPPGSNDSITPRNEVAQLSRFSHWACEDVCLCKVNALCVQSLVSRNATRNTKCVPGTPAGQCGTWCIWPNTDANHSRTARRTSDDPGGGGGGSSVLDTNYPPPTNCWPEAPLGGRGGGAWEGTFLGGGDGGGALPRGGGRWIGLDWCFAIFGRAIPGSQVTWPTRPVTLTCERPLHAQGPEAGVPYPPSRGPSGPPTHAAEAQSRCPTHPTGARSRCPTHSAEATIGTHCTLQGPRVGAPHTLQGPRAGAPHSL